LTPLDATQAAGDYDVLACECFGAVLCGLSIATRERDGWLMAIGFLVFIGAAVLGARRPTSWGVMH
jgi:hypothetical protein